ncbi:hypothetical protein K8352_03545 [Flavobacteriaceae bacterium F89]|uniref:Cytochrome C Planctomycete-type domain-containing protein n=1 Tax=Cerina litoralis TaxID=2874477 RepID=A0AAE3JMG0_9FLAO|nr:c-type cytochrome domain-containing protein [Cerina litoralis]MCG2459810.1 hypothetical protein [Cerina litoralis]
MDVIKQLVGRLHPLIVHLPIGFIILGLLLQWFDRKTKSHTKIIGLIYLWGGISAVVACVTGYMQYLGEGYSFDTIKFHLWMGITTAVFSFLMFIRLTEPPKIEFLKKIPVPAFALTMFLLISVTGHLGGAITHGEGYLVEPLPNSVKLVLGIETFSKKTILLEEETWKNAMIYQDVIDPVLNNNCVSCHNPKKLKGELQLNSEEGILKGGENGEIVSAHNASQSELYVRMTLPKDDEDHMPPKDKTQPTKEEIALIGAWLDVGHPFDKTIGELNMEKKLFQSFFPVSHNEDYPDIEIAKAMPQSIDSIKKTGVHVENISQATHFLRVSCVNKPSFADTDFKSLHPISKQIAILDLGGTQVTDSIFSELGGLPNLTVLKLDHTSVTGKNINALKNLAYLKSINLSFTDFNDTSLEQLSNFQALNSIYLSDTEVSRTAILTNQKTEPIEIDYGDYTLPTIAADTIVY